MHFNTDLFYIGGSKPKHNSMQRLHPIRPAWKLWFTVDTSKEPIVECHTFPVKPTNKQIRKLRRQFRKEAL